MSRQFNYLGDVEILLTVAQRGSLSAAAITLSTTPSVISRAITRLEARLGVQLLRRSTRQISLTDAGRLYLDRTRAAFDLIGEAEREIQGAPAGALSGTIRMSVPTTYGHHRLATLLPRFAELHPEVKIEIGIANRNVDLVAEGYDLAIRLGALRDSALASRTLEHASLRLVAAPDYLARHGVPRSLEDLEHHRLLPFVMPSTGRYGPWTLRINGHPTDWTPRGQIRVMDDVLGCVSLARHGAGICQSYDFILRDRLVDGSLVEVLPELAGCTRPFSLIFPAHRHLPRATRRLIDFLAEAVAS